MTTNFYDTIGKELSTAYADMMIKLFPEYDNRNDYNNLKARAMNVISFLFKNYFIVSKDKIEELIKDNSKSYTKLEVLKFLFTDKNITQFLFDIYEKSEKDTTN